LLYRVDNRIHVYSTSTAPFRASAEVLANYNISSDNDPLYRFHQWQANLRILEATEIKSIPYVPLSHPFVEQTPAAA